MEFGLLRLSPGGDETTSSMSRPRTQEGAGVKSRGSHVSGRAGPRALLGAEMPPNLLRFFRRQCYEVRAVSPADHAPPQTHPLCALADTIPPSGALLGFLLGVCFPFPKAFEIPLALGADLSPSVCRSSLLHHLCAVPYRSSCSVALCHVAIIE